MSESVNPQDANQTDRSPARQWREVKAAAALRDRIAQAIVAGIYQAGDDATDEQTWLTAADAIITELQLEERTRTPVTAYIDGQFQENQTLHRYVTPWKVK